MADKEFNKSLFHLMYYNNLNKQFEREVGDYLRANTNTPKNYSNDLRHQYVSALYSRNFGDNTAKTLGNLNEFFNFNASGRDDTAIDQINNEIGRNYGSQYPDIPRSKLMDILFNDYDKNLQIRKDKMKELGF